MTGSCIYFMDPARHPRSLVFSGNSSLSPAFAPATLAYAITGEPPKTDHVTVTAVTADPLATMAVQGVPTASGVASALIDLPAGVAIMVTGSDKKTTKSYTVQIVAALCPAAPALVDEGRAAAITPHPRIHSTKNHYQWPPMAV